MSDSSSRPENLSKRDADLLLESRFLQRQHQSLYAAFDRYPSAKGAAAHINRKAQTLFAKTSGGLLFVLGDETLPVYQKEEQIESVRFAEPVANFLEPTRAYSRALRALMAKPYDKLADGTMPFERRFDNQFLRAARRKSSA
jgi:hypothetical protein